MAEQVPEKFKKPYDPKATEAAIYQKWEESGYFNPDHLPGERTEPFSIVLPPPNVTGTLHLGHAYEDALQDAFVRFERMRGKKTLWLPGTDSAAIATQSKVETEIYKKEDKTRYDLGRDELLKRIQTFTDESKNTILNQVKRMGSSLDWSRYAYTMDEKRSKAVTEAFLRMFNAGLIYRGARIVNWDPKLQTTVSDDEIEWKEETTSLYHLKYGPFTIVTARPETKFGDKYVVMHPEDERYKEYTDGQQIELEWINGPITATVIKDSVIDREFGTGVMTITPWHDTTDFEIAERHDLPKEQVIDERGLLLPIAGEFAGQHIKKARPMIVEKLKSKGLIAKIEENYKHNIATNSRGGGGIEPQIKMQWFVAVNQEFEKNGQMTTLKKMMHEAVAGGAVKILPDHFEKIYYHWIDNLRDWCISRQIWFGHRIPVWYRGEEIHIGAVAPQGDGWEQDPDTLDTWFSSALWPFSTLGWPEETEDLKTYFPTSLMAPGYEIIFFWVARMILMSGFLLNETPFKMVFLHGIVRDKTGKKFSKSLGNGIDPIDIIDQFGADALRMALLVGAAPGSDIKFDETRVKGYKNFSNKLWNITRFVLENTALVGKTEKINADDQKIVGEATEIAKEATKHFETYRLDLAAETLYHFAWHRLADVLLEESKVLFKGEDKARAQSRATALTEVLGIVVKTLHPFMPFVTEEIWSSLPGSGGLLMVEPWPCLPAGRL
jgi:valyl-tRNA synthetase